MEGLKTKQEEVENEEETLKEIKKGVHDAYKKLVELREKNSEEYAEILSAVKKLVSRVLNENEDTLKLTDEHYNMIMQILEMIAVGNSELVRKGVADDIVKKIEATHKE